MASTARKLVKSETGYGTIGVNVFFSVADIYGLKDIIADIQRGGDDRDVAVMGLMNLHDKLINALNNNEDSLFNPQTDEENEL